LTQEKQTPYSNITKFQARVLKIPTTLHKPIAANSCDSEDHARVVSEVVDFASDAPVADENAIDFSYFS
jgi:hypothetical protein